MNRVELDNQFDTLYNNVTSNQAPGLNIYEKSVFLTKGQDEILKNYFNPKGNKYQEGFDGNQKRQIDFSNITCVKASNAAEDSVILKYADADTSKLIDSTKSLTFYIPESLGINEVDAIPIQGRSTIIPSPGLLQIKFDESEDCGADLINYLISLWPVLDGCYVTGNGLLSGQALDQDAVLIADDTEWDTTYSNNRNKIDPRSSLFLFPDDVLFVVNERVDSSINGNLRIIPVDFMEYDRLMSKPYKYPTKYTAWRLLNSGEDKYVELIAPGELTNYRIRYVRRPKPIILGDLDGLTINGYKFTGQTYPEAAPETDGECELDPILHEEILQRAVELAKAAWTSTGQDNIQAFTQMGQRSE